MSIDSPDRLVLMKVVQTRGKVDLPATGISMYPLIREGDICRFVSINPESIKKGDILLYQTEHGQLVAHRFIQKAGDLYLCKGDSNLDNDEWVCADQLIGKMLSVNKGHRVIHLNDKLGKAWTWSILTFPPISAVLRRLRAFQSNQVKR